MNFVKKVQVKHHQYGVAMQLIRVLPLFAMLSACSISIDRQARLGDLKVTDQGLLFTLGRTEYRHFAMADHESHTVQRATFAIYQIPNQDVVPNRIDPVLQQEATDWMGYLADTSRVVVDMSRKLVQPAYYGYKGPELLLPSYPFPKVLESGYGAEGFLYHRRTELEPPTYVAAGGASCDLTLSALKEKKVKYLLSDDGRYTAAIQSLDDIPYGQPPTTVTIEVFAGCRSIAMHQLAMDVRDRIDGLCIQNGEFWYSIWHSRVPRQGAYTALRYGSEELYQTSVDMDPHYVLASHSFDCAAKQFVWLSLGKDSYGIPLRKPVNIEVNRYQPVTGARSTSTASLIPAYK